MTDSSPTPAAQAGPGSESQLRKPNFFVAGVQKAGTTYLCAELARHPEIYFSPVKEPMFFNSKRYRDDLFGKYLQTNFSEAGDQRWLGEGSTLYFQSDEALARIREHIGRDIRVLVCLRNPVEKAVSLYLHNFRRGRLSGTERITELDATRWPVTRFSLYADWSRKWQAVFGRDALCYLSYGQLVTDPADFVGSALAHLSLEMTRAPEQKRINAGLKLVLDADGTLGPEPSSTPLLEGQVLPRFRPEELAELAHCFTEDLDELSAYVPEDLSADLRRSLLATG